MKEKEKDKKAKPTYIKCPRCELNYILSKEKCCDVCKAEMNLIDPNILIPEEEAEEILCPICKTNLMSADEEMCFLCAKESAEKNKDEEEEWLLTEKDDDIIDDDELEIPLGSLDEEEVEEVDFSSDDNETDFEYVSIEELEELDDDEDDEDDEEW